MSEEDIPKGRCILVAEDNAVNVELIRDMLSIHDHKVVFARNGKEAIEMAKQHKPELIFMDMQMPLMDGLTATKAIREIPEFAELPIIALTASTGDEAEERQISIGCTEHLAKPIQTKELFEILQRHLGKVKAPDKEE